MYGNYATGSAPCALQFNISRIFAPASRKLTALKRKQTLTFSNCHKRVRTEHFTTLKMTSVGWNQETKARLSDKVSANMNDVASLTRQILRGSKSNELLEKAAKNFAYQESCVENSSTTLKRMGLLASHLQFQAEAIERSVSKMDDIQDQLRTIQR